MKKIRKILLITLGSIAGLVLATAAVALWLVFTPARLTPIVSKQLPRLVTCRAAVERVELTFFSSFPRLGLQIEGLSLVNPIGGAPCDTLLRLEKLGATVDVKAFLRRDELILSDIVLHDGAICLYTDSLGRTNYDIIRPTSEFAADTSDTSTDSGFSPARIDADRITLDNIDVRWLDDASAMRADIRGFSTTVRASMNGADIAGMLAVSRPFDVEFSAGRADSLLTASMKVLEINAEGSLSGDVADAGLVSLGMAGVTVVYGGTEYLRDGAVSLAASASTDLAARSAEIHSLALTLNELKFELDGSVRDIAPVVASNAPGAVPLRIAADLHYRLAQWPLDRLLALVPQVFAHYLDGISAGGILSSEGTVRGIYSEDSMPVIDAAVTFDGGRVDWPAMLPWPLTDIVSGVDLHIDPQEKDKSYAKISGFSARTPRSSLRARGTLDRLFSDLRADLIADVDADLADAAPLIPASLPVSAGGKASGRVNVAASMSQLANMQFDAVRASGSLAVSGLDARYDTVSVTTPSARLDFAFPNPGPSTRNTAFGSLSLAADRLDAQMGEGAGVRLDGARIALETSDVLDTMSFPAVVCDFAFVNLAARMDDVSVSVADPQGKVSTEPGLRAAGSPQRINIVYNSGEIAGQADDIKAVLEKLDIDASIDYAAMQNNVPQNTAQTDIWQRLSPYGNIVAGGFEASVPSLNYPVRVPDLAMDFTPEHFNIRRARVVLDESDFSLAGTVDNIIPYSRGDSVLRAEFDFSSPVTNISQLLALTSGIGGEEVEKTSAPDQFTGPYMVPRGIDVMLHAGIDEVLWEGRPLLSNVRGEVQVKDGALFISPRLSFDSPATHGEIQMMYRTPDRNNLFTGVSIHLEQIEMQELTRMVPDLDILMPMLSSFSGQGEFHAAAEGYMDSTYRYKMSTLRGAGSIGATNLVLRDDETFRKIAFLLKYKDEGVIRVDSLRAEFTVFRNEIDIYPFLLKIDRYGAVISGRHNLDMNFDYNISLVQSPFPFRVAVDVQGRQGDLKFKVFSKSRYPDFYRPKYQGVVENRQLELRNIIRNSLLEGRKEDE